MSTRLPAEAHSPRIEALARLPVFYALAGKRAVVAGGSTPAAWKAELLAAAGAAVEVYAVAPSEEMRELSAQAGVTLHRRAIASDDMAQAAIAVGAFDDD